MRLIVPTLCAGMFAAVCAGAAVAQVASTAVNPPDAAPAAPAAAFPTVRIVPANAPPAGARPAGGKDANELICKTSLVTGSLVARQRTCLTRKQWAYVNDAHEDEARKMMMDNMGKPNGN